MTLAQFFGLLRADPAILVPGAAQASQGTPMQAFLQGRAEPILHRRADAEPDAKQAIRKLVRGVVAFRRAGKKK